jgi:hypothetical protein
VGTDLKKLNPNSKTFYMKQLASFIILTFLFLNNSFAQTNTILKKIYSWEIKSVGGAAKSIDGDKKVPGNSYFIFYIEATEALNNVTIYLNNGKIYTTTLKKHTIFPISFENEKSIIEKTKYNIFDCEINESKTIKTSLKIKNMLKTNALVLSYFKNNIQYYGMLKIIPEKYLEMP